MVAVGKNVLEKCVHMRGERNNVRIPGLFRSCSVCAVHY